MKIAPCCSGTKSNSIIRKISKPITSLYYANKPLDMAPQCAPKLPLGTRIVKFFKGLINANRY